MRNKSKKSFEDYITIIDREIERHRSKWTLTAISWMDFDDVGQIIRIHIFKKWKMYKQHLPIEPWIRAIINNQIKNLRRNVYDNNSRPCLRCAAAENRAFVRCVRNFLKINIVSKEEINSKEENLNPVLSNSTNVEILENVMASKRLTFPQIKQKLIKDGYPEADKLNSLTELPKEKIFDLIDRIKKFKG